jgi:hypothetical protein
VEDVQVVAASLAAWLSSRSGVTNMQPPIVAAHPPEHSWFHWPRAVVPSFEIKCQYKGRARHFRYFIEHLDDLQSVEDTLRVHTNGELMIQIPDGFGGLQRNDIFYGNSSVAATVLGGEAPR